MRNKLLEMLRSLSLKRGDFVLASGAKSDFYIDARLTTFTSAGAFAAGKVMEAMLPKGISAIGGPAVGAAPIVTALSIISGIDGFLVRKAAKDHGTGGRIVGLELVAGEGVVMVEDVVTTGGSLARAIDAVEATGAKVVKVLALVDRGGGAFKTHDFEAVFTLDEVLA